MTRQNYTHRLPQLRVSQDVFEALKQVAEDSNTKLTDVMRYALENFVKTDIAGDDGITIPISGVLSNKGIVFNLPPKFTPPMGSNVRARYLDVEPIGGA